MRIVNRVIVLILLIISLIIIYLILTKLPLEAVKNLKVWVRVIWGGFS